MIPVRPKNQQHPMKRTRDMAAVAIRRNLKNCAVRSDVVPYDSVSIKLFAIYFN